jgi:hypothetical protein
LEDSQFLTRVGGWFAASGIQEASGGVARYYRSDVERNLAVSTEITGYAASTFVYLHAVTGEARYLDRAVAAARFLSCTAWRTDLRTMPFELEPGPEGLLAYFFDCGIVARGLLAVYRETREEEFLEAARMVGDAMARDFTAEDGEMHPILRLPEKRPVTRDERWSRSPGCYQLKSAMAWYELAEATGEARYSALYDRALERALATEDAFLPGHPDRAKVMDRLHAYCYFLEGMLPRAGEARCAAAIRLGLDKVAHYLREIGPEFERSDVVAQLLRMRIYAGEAAGQETARLASYQVASEDARTDGGFWFGKKGGVPLPYVNPVSTGFALQALTTGGQAHRHLLI